MKELDLSSLQPPFEPAPSLKRLSLSVCVSVCLSLTHPGENPLPPDDPNKEVMGKTEVSLTLANKFDVPGEANAEVDAKTLLLKYVINTPPPLWTVI